MDSAQPVQPALPPPPTISKEERGLAALTHLSGLAGYIIPLGGVLVPIVIMLVKSESKVITTVAKQALLRVAHKMPVRCRFVKRRHSL